MLQIPKVPRVLAREVWPFDTFGFFLLWPFPRCLIQGEVENSAQSWHHQHVCPLTKDFRETTASIAFMSQSPKSMKYAFPEFSRFALKRPENFNKAILDKSKLTSFYTRIWPEVTSPGTLG